MKQIFVKDLMGKSLKDLIKMRNKFQDELYHFKLKNSLRGLKQTHLIKFMRRNIAKVNTAFVMKMKNF